MNPYVTSVDPDITSGGKWVLMPHKWVNGFLCHISGKVGPYISMSHQWVSVSLCHVSGLMGPYVTSVDPYVTSEDKWVLMLHQWVNGSLQSKCFRLAAGSPWYIGNRQIHVDWGVPSSPTTSEP